MNKQELIKQIKKLFVFGVKDYIEREEVLKLVEQLDEPEKVTIPQFVADWIEECEEKEKTLLNSLLYTPEGVNSWVGNSDNQELFARAWLDGYEVEKEKKYKIALLNRNDGTLYLVNRNAGVADKYGHFSPVVLFFTKETKFSEQCYELTKQDVVSNGFGWVFDCEGVEIEEVTE